MQPNVTPKGRRKLRAEKISNFRDREINPRLCCEHCNAPNYVMIMRGIYYDETLPEHPATPAYKFAFKETKDSPDAVFSAISGKIIGSGNLHAPGPPITAKVLLTYLDGNPANEEPYNTRFLCQLCHARQTAVVRSLRRQIERIKPRTGPAGPPERDLQVRIEFADGDL